MNKRTKIRAWVLPIILLIVAQAIPALGAKNNTSNKDQPLTPAVASDVPRTASGKIDLLRADPSQVDLARVDPAEIELTKAIVQQLDISKWDLKLIDVTRVEDGLAAKWIGKRIKEQQDRQKAMSRYGPGELERIQEENLNWLREPAPFSEPTFEREHKLTQAQTQAYAARIDGILLKKLRESNQDFNAPSSDEQFVRRIYISAAGRIPTASQAMAFIADTSKTKRQDLIDQLLLSENYPSQMFNWAANMLRVQDLKSNQGDNDAYQAWLIDQFGNNRPWDKVVHEMLTAEGDIVSEPAVGWLVRDAGMPLGSLANTLTTFMGASVSCAECHDHPFNSYTQRDFYQLAAFFGSTEVGEKNLRDAPKILKNRYHYVKSAPKDFLTFPPDYMYGDVKPSSRVTPSFAMLQSIAPRLEGTKDSPLGREDFAAWMTSKDNQQFAATIANRLWAKTFGMPVMSPMTEMDNLDDASNPQLIHGIADLMRELDFDLMAFQRVIYSTRAWQAEASVSPQVGVAYDFPGPVLRRMTAEETWDSLVTLVKGEELNAYQRDRRLQAWSNDVFKDGYFEYLANSKPIEHEKLAAEAERMSKRLLLSQHPKSQQKKNTSNDAKFVRASELKQPEVENHFLRQFGQAERELADANTSEGGIPQSLMLMNGPVSKMLAKPEAYIMQAAGKTATPSEKVDFLYMSFLGRNANQFEQDYISGEKITLSRLTWILMNTREFMFVQ